MDDQPYTTPDEDPFNVQPLLSSSRRRRSSMLDKWIKEQQITSSASSSSARIHDLTDDVPGRGLNPYLAYPDLPCPRLNPSPCDSAATLNSYVLVDDDDIPTQHQEGVLSEAHDATPSTPTSQRRPNFLGSPPSSFRQLHLSFRPQSPTPSRQSQSPSPMLRSNSRLSFLPLSKGSGRSTPNAKQHNQHNRSSSLSTLNTQTSSPSTSTPDFPSPTSTKWRPSVLGFFSSPSTSSQVSVLHSESLYASSRPSMSSSNTGTSTSITTPSTVMEDVPPSPKSPTKSDAMSRSFVSSIRSRRRSHGNTLHVASSSEQLESSATSCRHGSVRGGSLRLPFAPKGGSLMNSNCDPQEEDEEKEEDYDDDDDDECCQRAMKSGPVRPEVAFSASSKGGTLPRVSFASLNQKKKKKLVISGIAPNEARKFDGAKRWCETFGEVSRIVRMPNGDLHVHFRSAEVADTVCRLRAKVYIAGVGSVNLSWYTGNKR